jgi:signal transduction histidine kinase/ActR/RegA family two-component response regulator
LLARKMVVPIAALRAGAARIGGGDFEQRIAVKTGDELEALADQFNHMAAQLHESHANLQLRVERRTAELTSANRRLANAGERLRRANAFKSEMLGTVAHDLKNPMSVIMMRTELLSGLINVTPLPREKIAANILAVRHASDRLVDMVNSLLADAMTDAHEISIRRSPVDIPALISEVAETNRPHAEMKQQTFAVAAPASLTLSVDHDRLREAIDNLVSNAIKYTPRSGKIDLTVTCEADHARIRVADNGLGLTADDMTRLFGRFQRLSARPTGGESSTGLGLSIVKRIAELHGGKVAAESAGSGRGATFTISLPLTSAFPEMLGRCAAGDSPGRVHKAGAADALLSSTILVIEDNGFVRESLDTLLRSEGLTVVSAASGAEALDLITGKQLRPDLVVSDYNLQENMNGLEAVASLRAALGWKLPAVVMTGDSRLRVLQAIAGQDVAVVAKPWEGDELVQLIRKSVGSSLTQAPQA